ncbi:unnamed protein product [Dicrocoelium dendriticum]|nr:unnamed protein product [Dicrocoelium dendriticum]
MFALMKFLCCFGVSTRHSPSKRSNLLTLRELMVHLGNKSEAENAEVHPKLERLISDLRHSTMSDRPPTTSPNVGNNVAYHASSTSPANNADSSSYRSQPVGIEVATVVPSLDDSAEFRRMLITFLSTYCTTTQLELIVHLDWIKHWSEAVQAARLDHPLQPPLPEMIPRPCSVAAPGRLRIASWNVNRFSLAKANHPGFREILCLSILRANISLLVLQEVTNLDVANVICSELNSPSLPHVKRWLNRFPPPYIHRWDAATSIQATGALFRGREFAVFLYNTNAGIEIVRTSLLEPSETARSSKLFSRSPCPSLCKIRSSRVVLVSVHLKARGLHDNMIDKTVSEVKCLENLIQAFHDTQPENSHLIILGDFNLNPQHPAFDSLRKRGFFPVLNGSQSTTTGKSPQPVDNSENATTFCVTSYDNAWLSPTLAVVNPSADILLGASYTGDAGVITDGLRHPLIPEELATGINGSLSDHCPIWFDLQIP